MARKFRDEGQTMGEMAIVLPLLLGLLVGVLEFERVRNVRERHE